MHLQTILYINTVTYNIVTQLSKPAPLKIKTLYIITYYKTEFIHKVYYIKTNTVRKQSTPFVLNISLPYFLNTYLHQRYWQLTFYKLVY